MTILVTGGAGYIGSHFVRHLERRKIDFVIVDNFSTGHKKLVENKKFFELDLSCLLYTSPSPRDYAASRMPSSA